MRADLFFQTLLSDLRLTWQYMFYNRNRNNVLMGETQSAACLEQASSPKTLYLVQKHDVLCHVTMTTFGQDTYFQQQMTILSTGDCV